MNRKNIIYVIYDIETYEILARFTTEEECIKEYADHFNKEKCDWTAINLKNIIANLYWEY